MDSTEFSAHLFSMIPLWQLQGKIKLSPVTVVEAQRYTGDLPGLLLSKGYAAEFMVPLVSLNHAYGITGVSFSTDAIAYIDVSELEQLAIILSAGQEMR